MLALPIPLPFVVVLSKPAGSCSAYIGRHGGRRLGQANPNLRWRRGLYGRPEKAGTRRAAGDLLEVLTKGGVS